MWTAAKWFGKRMTTMRVPTALPVVLLTTRQVMRPVFSVRQVSVIATKRRGRWSASLRTAALFEPLTLVVVHTLLLRLEEHDTLQRRQGMGCVS
jgi:hypothetical protein